MSRPSKGNLRAAGPARSGARLAIGGRSPVMDDLPSACATPRMCVLASGSSGNCTALVIEAAGKRRIVLIDCGLSPRRTRKLLRELGLDPEDVTDILITHRDQDHWHPGWGESLPGNIRVHVHRRHADLLRAYEPRPRGLARYDSDFELCEGVGVAPTLLAHDAAGVVAFRIEFGWAGTLGFATDVGRLTTRMIEHLREVDVLAIESNYCPRLQAASPRPEFLKSRIMGGSGHLSNAQCGQAVRAISPRKHVVLLHLSRECNTPELAAVDHRGGGYALTISTQTSPTAWIDLVGTPRKRADVRVHEPAKARVVVEPAAPHEQPVLFAL